MNGRAYHRCMSCAIDGNTHKLSRDLESVIMPGAHFEGFIKPRVNSAGGVVYGGFAHRGEWVSVEGELKQLCASDNSGKHKVPQLRSANCDSDITTTTPPPSLATRNRLLLTMVNLPSLLRTPPCGTLSGV